MRATTGGSAAAQRARRARRRRARGAASARPPSDHGSHSGSAPPPTADRTRDARRATRSGARGSQRRRAGGPRAPPASARAAASMRSAGISAARPVAVELERRLERGQRQLVGAQRAHQRVRAHARDGRALPDEDAGLRPAEQLVAREGAPGRRRATHRRAARLGSRGRGPSARRSISAPEPRSTIVGTPRARASCGQLGDATSAVKPTTREVRAVHLEQQRRAPGRSRPA